MKDDTPGLSGGVSCLLLPQAVTDFLDATGLPRGGSRLLLCRTGASRERDAATAQGGGIPKTLLRFHVAAIMRLPRASRGYPALFLEHVIHHARTIITQ